ncbi:MAG: 2'-deoxycytidine 5'-triphosphate deaminase [bacterium]|nr:2'-deoxycytidine 5'-triphosphate deaminase [bacterium]
MAKHFGALPDTQLLKFIKSGVIHGAQERHVGPASLDLTVSHEIYRINGVFQPRQGESIAEILPRLDARSHGLGAPLECDVVYLAKLNESIHLPADVYGYCNPKSSTGRHDLHVRVVADGVPRYDSITPKGFRGDLWVIIVPRSYPIILPPGEPVSQLRLFNKDTRFKEKDLQEALKKYQLLFTPKGKPIPTSEILVTDNDGSIILTLDLESEIPGYEYIGRKNVLDFGKGKKSYDHHEFFQPIKVDNGFALLKRGGFYILSTREAVSIPPEFASEMAPMDERCGEFRSHYAGFLDPGWGYGQKGEGKGRPFTLEVRPFEDMVVSNKHPIARIKFERMSELPKTHYDARVGSNYAVQRGPKLAKHFK